MKFQKDFKPLGCAECAGGAGLDFDFTMAFQPIVNTTNQQVYSHEVLVRGINNESAGQVFEFVNDTNLYRFDQTYRMKAIKLCVFFSQYQFYAECSLSPRTMYSYNIGCR